MQIDYDYFSVLGVEKSYQVDLSKVKFNYLKLQHKFHPDKFAGASEAEKLMAVKMTSHLNEAVTVLQDDVMRAEYLLSLSRGGVSEKNTLNDSEFLMSQMKLREKLTEASTTGTTKDLYDLMQEIRDYMVNLKNEFSENYPRDLNKANSVLQKMKFYHKLQNQAQDALDEYQ